MLNSFSTQSLSVRKRLPFFYILLFFLVSSLYANSQWTNIPVTQIDSRFTLTAERSWGFGEVYDFYIKNNTSDAYDIVVDITLHLACVGTKTFTLGVNQVAELEPNGSFSPDNDYVHGYTPPSPDNFKDCRLADGNTYTLFQGMEYHIRKIVNKTQEARLAEQKKKEEAEKQKQQEALEKKKQEEEEARQKQLEAQKKQAEVTQQKNKSTAQNTTNNKIDDFWETGNSSSKANVTGNTTKTETPKLPEFFRTTDGKYYHKQGDQITEVSQAQYQQLKQQKVNQVQSQVTQTVTLTPEQQKRVVDDIMTKVKSEQQQSQQDWDDINNKFSMQQNAYAAGNEAENASKELQANTTLQGNYQSADQLMADFNQQMANINNLSNTIVEKRNEQVNTSVDAAFSDPQYKAYGEGVKLLGNLLNSANEAKERKQAMERLRQEKEAALNQMAAEQKSLLTQVRTSLFARFKEGSLPISSTKVNANTLYYFAYAYDPQQIGTQQTTLYISNVFPISRYSDGTWPFKSNISSEISKLTPYSEVLHGYYTSKEEAESMRKGMINIFLKTGGYSKDISYKGKLNTGTINSGDFWETGKKKAADSSSTAKPVKKDDFWNN